MTPQSPTHPTEPDLPTKWPNEHTDHPTDGTPEWEKEFDNRFYHGEEILMPKKHMLAVRRFILALHSRWEKETEQKVEKARCDVARAIIGMPEHLLSNTAAAKMWDKGIAIISENSNEPKK